MKRPLPVLLIVSVLGNERNCKQFAQNEMSAEEKSLARSASLILIIGLMAAGCTYNTDVDARLDSPPLVELLPVKVGVFYSAEFKSYIHKAELGEGPSVTLIPVGQPSVALFDQIFDSMFERPVRVDARPPTLQASKNLDGVIEIALDSFVADSGWQVAVKFQVTIYDPMGQTIASWPVVGTGYEKYFHGFSNPLGLETERALRSAAANFIIDFYKQPEVLRWLDTAKDT